jgi:hypothetical protein
MGSNHVERKERFSGSRDTGFGLPRRFERRTPDVLFKEADGRSL